MSEKAPNNKINPEQVLLSAFEYFKTDKLDLESLRRIGKAGNSPSDEITEGVFNNLVKTGVLEWEKDEQGKVWFKLVKIDKSKLN